MKEWTIEQFVSELASKAPVPGGGGAAALGGAVGSALGGMVGNLTVGKKKYADVEERVLQVLSEADRLQQELLYLMEEDSRAFEPLSRAYGMPKATEAERAAKEQVMEVALRDASLVPLQIMETAGQMLDLLEELAQIGSRLAISSVIGNAHQTNATPACPFLTTIEKIPASGKITTNCRIREITSDSKPLSSA